jgi:hypothetical protein
VVDSTSDDSTSDDQEGKFIMEYHPSPAPSRNPPRSFATTELPSFVPSAPAASSTPTTPTKNTRFIGLVKKKPKLVQSQLTLFGGKLVQSKFRPVTQSTNMDMVITEESTATDLYNLFMNLWVGKISKMSGYAHQSREQIVQEGQQRWKAVPAVGKAQACRDMRKKNKVVTLLPAAVRPTPRFAEDHPMHRQCSQATPSPPQGLSKATALHGTQLWPDDMRAVVGVFVEHLAEPHKLRDNLALDLANIVVVPEFTQALTECSLAWKTLGVEQVLKEWRRTRQRARHSKVQGTIDQLEKNRRMVRSELVQLHEYTLCNKADPTFGSHFSMRCQVMMLSIANLLREFIGLSEAVGQMIKKKLRDSVHQAKRITLKRAALTQETKYLVTNGTEFSWEDGFKQVAEATYPEVAQIAPHELAELGARVRTQGCIPLDKACIREVVHRRRVEVLSVEMAASIVSSEFPVLVVTHCRTVFMVDMHALQECAQAASNVDAGCTGAHRIASLFESITHMSISRPSATVNNVGTQSPNKWGGARKGAGAPAKHVKHPLLTHTVLEFIKMGCSAQGRRRSETLMVGVRVSDIHRHLKKTMPELKIDKRTIRHLMMPPVITNRAAKSYHQVINANIPPKRNDKRRKTDDAHWSLAEVRLHKEELAQFPDEVVLLSGDRKAKLKVGTPCISRQHEIQRLFLLESYPDYDDHDFVEHGYLLDVAGYMELQQKPSAKVLLRQCGDRCADAVPRGRRPQARFGNAASSESDKADSEQDAHGRRARTRGSETGTGVSRPQARLLSEVEDDSEDAPQRYHLGRGMDLDGSVSDTEVHRRAKIRKVFDRHGRERVGIPTTGTPYLTARALLFDQADHESNANDLRRVIAKLIAKYGKYVFGVDGDGGSDYSLHSWRTLVCIGRIFRDLELEGLFLYCRAGGLSAYNDIEHFWSALSRILVGVTFPATTGGDKDAPCRQTSISSEEREVKERAVMSNALDMLERLVRNQVYDGFDIKLEVVECDESKGAAMGNHDHYKNGHVVEEFANASRTAICADPALLGVLEETVLILRHCDRRSHGMFFLPCIQATCTFAQCRRKGSEIKAPQFKAYMQLVGGKPLTAVPSTSHPGHYMTMTEIISKFKIQATALGHAEAVAMLAKPDRHRPSFVEVFTSPNHDLFPGYCDRTEGCSVNYNFWSKRDRERHDMIFHWDERKATKAIARKLKKSVAREADKVPQPMVSTCRIVVSGNQCGLQFTSRHRLQTHVKAAHPGEKNPYDKRKRQASMKSKKKLHKDRPLQVDQTLLDQTLSAVTDGEAPQSREDGPAWREDGEYVKDQHLANCLAISEPYIQGSVAVHFVYPMSKQLFEQNARATQGGLLASPRVRAVTEENRRWIIVWTLCHGMHWTELSVSNSGGKLEVLTFNPLGPDSLSVYVHELVGCDPHQVKDLNQRVQYETPLVHCGIYVSILVVETVKHVQKGGSLHNVKIPTLIPELACNTKERAIKDNNTAYIMGVRQALKLSIEEKSHHNPEALWVAAGHDSEDHDQNSDAVKEVARPIFKKVNAKKTKSKNLTTGCSPQKKKPKEVEVVARVDAGHESEDHDQNADDVKEVARPIFKKVNAKKTKSKNLTTGSSPQKKKLKEVEVVARVEPPVELCESILVGCHNDGHSDGWLRPSQFVVGRLIVTQVAAGRVGFEVSQITDMDDHNISLWWWAPLRKGQFTGIWQQIHKGTEPWIDRTPVAEIGAVLQGKPLIFSASADFCMY